MKRLVFAVAALAAWAALAQDTPPVDQPLPKKTVVVPLPPPNPNPNPNQNQNQQQQQQQQQTPMVVPLPKDQPPDQPIAPPEQPTTPPDQTQLTPDQNPAPQPEPPPGAMIDGHLREGPFLSGPGSLTFVVHHTLLLAGGGLATQIPTNGQSIFDVNTRTAALAGLLIGAGLGFGASSWWQFNHWISLPTANFGIVNSIVGGMLFAGLADALSNSDRLFITWSSIIGAELAAWLTVTLGTGDMPNNKGLLIVSGAGWAAAYAALLVAIIAVSSPPSSVKPGVDTMLIAPGLGAIAMAIAAAKYNPSSAQVLRADAFGAAVGGAVLALSFLVLLPNPGPTPYILAMVSSAAAMTVVSLLWSEAAERPALYRDPEKDRPYSNVWW